MNLKKKLIFFLLFFVFCFGLYKFYFYRKQRKIKKVRFHDYKRILYFDENDSTSTIEKARKKEQEIEKVNFGRKEKIKLKKKLVSVLVN